jgi:hypothetical protein
MSEQPTPFGTMPTGQEIPRQYPNGVIGYVDPHRQATEHRVAQARRFFPQASRDDFELVGPSGRRWRDRASGEEYRTDASDPFQLRDPRKSGISCFIIDGWQIIYLSRRGEERFEEQTDLGDVPEGRELSTPQGEPWIR